MTPIGFGLSRSKVKVTVIFKFRGAYMTPFREAARSNLSVKLSEIVLKCIGTVVNKMYLAGSVSVRIDYSKKKQVEMIF